MNDSKKLGEILIDKKLLCQVTADRVAAIAKKLGKRVGVVLEEMGLVTEEELAQALAVQFSLRTVLNFAKATFPPELLAIVPAEVALENMVFPLRLEEKRLALALVDPSSRKIADNIAANNALTLVPFVSTRKEIKAAISRHYFGKETLDSSRRTILIAEDDKAIRAMMVEALSGQYKVVSAVDGLDAYKEVITNKPHVVLTDKEMPKLNGYALLGALKSVPETKHIPIILISGTTDASAEADAFAKGFFDFIQKPVKETTLLTRVKRAYDFSENHNYPFMR